jgi:hypothetical protein
MSRRTPLEQKLGTFIRMLASERDGEVVAAARAIVRTLKAAGADIHVLAERVETANGSKLTDGEMRLRRRLRRWCARSGSQTARS